MDMIRWQDIYEVHVEEIDSQHKKLVKLVNTMAEAMRAGKGKTVIGRVLTDLVEYTGYHFAAEERIFRQHGYPDLETHAAMHRDLTTRVQELKKNFDQGRPLITARVMLFMSDWLNKHIVEEDRKFGRYLGERTTAAKAS